MAWVPWVVSAVAKHIPVSSHLEQFCLLVQMLGFTCNRERLVSGSVSKPSNTAVEGEVPQTVGEIQPRPT